MLSEWVSGQGVGVGEARGHSPSAQQRLATASAQAETDPLLTHKTSWYCWDESNLFPLIDNTGPTVENNFLKNHFLKKYMYMQEDLKDREDTAQ